MFTTVARAQDLRVFIERLNDFCTWLLSPVAYHSSLSLLAEQVCRFFHLEYCSIHIRTKLHQLSGNFADESCLEIPESLKANKDRSFGTLQLADEQMLEVRNFPIQLQTGKGFLTVKSKSLSDDAIKAIANTIGLFLINGVS